MSNFTGSARSERRATFSVFVERSGLSWEQLAKMFGVSKSTVHMWAANGAVAENSMTVTRKLLTILDEEKTVTPEDGKAALMRTRDNGCSLFNEERRKHASKDDDINRSCP